MLLGDKVKIIMEELDSKAASIPGYMEDYYTKAIKAALTRIDRQEAQEGTKQKVSIE